MLPTQTSCIFPSKSLDITTDLQIKDSSQSIPGPLSFSTAFPGSTQPGNEPYNDATECETAANSLGITCQQMLGNCHRFGPKKGSVEKNSLSKKKGVREQGRLEKITTPPLRILL